MQDFETLYEILEIPESAKPEEIRSAYRRLVKEYHPDRVPEHLRKLKKDAEEKFKGIQEAWAVLGDPAKRRQYDEALKEHRERSRPQPPEAPSHSYTPPPPPPTQPSPPPWRTSAATQSPPPNPNGRKRSPAKLAGALALAVVVSIAVANIFRSMQRTTLRSLETGISALPPKPKEPLRMGVRHYSAPPGRVETSGGEVDVQLLHVRVEPNGVELAFRVRAGDRGGLLLYEPPDSKRERRDMFGLKIKEDFEELYIRDDTGAKFYSTTGLVGGQQESFNNYNLVRQISLRPQEEVVLSARFPPISKFASTITFVSPSLNGWQAEWHCSTIDLTAAGAPTATDSDAFLATFHAAVTDAVGTILKQTSTDPPRYVVELMFTFRGVKEVEVPEERIRPM